jgi:predicted DNA-binding helix-hairpin-helix protein
MKSKVSSLLSVCALLLLSLSSFSDASTKSTNQESNSAFSVGVCRCHAMGGHCLSGSIISLRLRCNCSYVDCAGNKPVEVE